MRLAERADIPLLGALDVVLPDHQARSPVFSAGGRPSVEEAIEEWEQDFDDDRLTTFVAEVDGAGRSLGVAVIRWAADGGYRSVVADWRATNLLSSRTWPRLGFEPTFLRLHRTVGW